MADEPTRVASDGALPVVAIIGRPNVGKSTLFNRLVRERRAVVEDTPGVTRDRLYARAEAFGTACLLVDTGGIDPAESDPVKSQARLQALASVDEADLVLFVVDGQEGPTPIDREVADILRRSGKPYLLVANKVESPRERAEEVYGLGLGGFLPVSALHGRGMGDLMEALADRLPSVPEEEEEEEGVVRAALVGRPNVGKSSLINAILGEERVIVSEAPGTTRDAVDVRMERRGREFILIDTAGMRRKAQVKEALEYYCVLRAIQAIERADVVVCVLEAVEGVSAQDRRIMGMAHQAGRGLILAVNKWDLMRARAAGQEVDLSETLAPRLAGSQEKHLLQDYTRIVRHEASFVDYAPLLFVSALQGEGIGKLIDEIALVAEHHAFRIPTARLNEVLRQATFETPPPTRKGHPLRVLYATQTSVKPPTIVLFVNDPERMHFSYQRYLENRFREAFNFEGTPVRFLLRARKERRQRG